MYKKRQKTKNNTRGKFLVPTLTCLFVLWIAVVVFFGGQEKASGAYSGNIISFFNREVCPDGWVGVKDNNGVSITGRYLVGLNLGGDIGSSVGIALGDKENRPVGAHTHNINEDDHTHSFSKQDGGKEDANSSGSKTVVSNTQPYTSKNSYFAKSEVSVDMPVVGGTNVPGTPAPYIQLLVCEKSFSF